MRDQVCSSIHADLFPIDSGRRWNLSLSPQKFHLHYLSFNLSFIASLALIIQIDKPLKLNISHLRIIVNLTRKHLNFFSPPRAKLRVICVEQVFLPSQSVLHLISFYIKLIDRSIITSQNLSLLSYAELDSSSGAFKSRMLIHGITRRRRCAFHNLNIIPAYWQ